MLMTADAAPPIPWALVRRRWAQAIRDARELYKLPGSLVVIPSRGHDSSSGRGSPAWGRHGSVAYGLGLLTMLCGPEGQRLARLVELQLMDGGSSTRAIAAGIGRSHTSVWRDLTFAWTWLCNPNGGHVLSPDAWQRGIEEESE